MIFKKKETYIAPTTTFDYILDTEHMLLEGSNRGEGNDQELGDIEDELNNSRSEVGFSDDTFDFGSW